jgi:hypothetical protein
MPGAASGTVMEGSRGNVEKMICLLTNERVELLRWAGSKIQYMMIEKAQNDLITRAYRQTVVSMKEIKEAYGNDGSEEMQGKIYSITYGIFPESGGGDCG